MRRTAKRVAACGFAMACLLVQGVCSGSTVEAAEEQPKAEAAAAAAAEVPAAAGEKIIHTFADQAKVDEFARLWQQRQATVLRMTVLRSYFQEEQAALEKLNEQFTKQYNLDVSKNYRFDNERRVIVELPEPAAPEASLPSP